MRPFRKKILKIISASFALALLILSVVAYAYYLDLKKVLLLKVSQKATALLGQRVDIGDLSISPSGRIGFHEIVLRNPEGFQTGELLKVKRLSLDVRLRELLRGGLSFVSIEIKSPELTLIIDNGSILNISDGLRHFLSEKGTTEYAVDEFKIDSGSIDINHNILSSGRDVNLSLKNLSSHLGAKTLVSGSLSYGGSRLKIDGWAYLKDKPNPFNISVSSEDIHLSAFRETLKSYNIDVEKIKFTLLVHAEGDMEGGCRLTSDIQLKNAGFFSFYNAAKGIRINADAFVHLRDHSVIVNDISLYAGDIPAVRLNGMITGIPENPSYAADIKISGIDLSDFNFLRGSKMGGMLASDHLKVKGGKTVQEISGSVRLENGAVQSPDIAVEGAKANLIFSSDNTLSLQADLSARILRVRQSLSRTPADVRISMEAKGKPEKMAVRSNLHFSPLEIKTGGDRVIRLGGLDSSLVGNVEKGISFTGRGFFEMSSLTYASYAISRLNGGFGVDYRKNMIAVRDLKINSEEGRASAGLVTIHMNEKKAEYVFAVKGMNALFPRKESEMKHADLNLSLHAGKKTMTGNAIFSLEEMVFRGVPVSVRSGSVSFAEDGFSVDITDAGIARGKVTMNAKGKVSGGPFPVEAKISAENVDLLGISRAVSKSLKVPYYVTGNIRSATFDGSMDSALSLRGRASLRGRNLSLLKTDTNRILVKDIAFISDIACKGTDCEFKSDITAGNVSATILVDAQRFATKERFFKMRALLRETKIGDIRNALWDIFPDDLLYAKLDGYASSEVLIDAANGGVKISGSLRLRDIFLEGENGEYSAGPINGTIPLLYDNTGRAQNAVEIPSFERSEFSGLARYYSQEMPHNNNDKITIGSFKYGFRLLSDIDIRITPSGNTWNIGRFSANIFGGRLNGAAGIDISEGVHYRGGFLLEGLSLTKLCEDVEPIKGYLSGKIDGIGAFKGSGTGFARLIAKAEFWSYSSGGERTKMSREFLQKIGGSSLKTYMRDRSFDKGVMSLYLEDGFVIFKELEISNRNMLGITDLSVKVAPFNNRIEVGHLLWTITEAARRAASRR